MKDLENWLKAFLGVAALAALVGVFSLPSKAQAPIAAGQYLHTATSSTFTVKSGSGYLHSVNVNTKGSAGSVTVYDGVGASSVNVIAVIDSGTASIGFNYDVAFTAGLTIVTTGAPDVTVSYR